MADRGDAGLQAGGDGRGAQRPLLLRVGAARPRARGGGVARAGGGRRVPRRRRPPGLPALRQLDRRRPRRQPVRDRGGDRGDAARAPGPGPAAAAPGHRAAPRPSQHRRAARRGRRSSARACGRTPRLFPEEAKRAEERYRRQPYRQKLLYVYRKLGDHAGGERAALARRPPRAAGHLRRRARAAGGPAPPAAQPAPRTARGGWPTAASRTCARQVEIFGFHLASLDLRQHAARHAEAIAEVLGRYGLASPYAEASEEERARLLTAEIRVRAALRPAPARLQPRHERDARALPPRPPRPRAESAPPPSRATS